MTFDLAHDLRYDQSDMEQDRAGLWRAVLCFCLSSGWRCGWNRL